MNIADFEIGLSNGSINHKNKLIKKRFYYSNMNIFSIILLFCFGYYYDQFNWCNGFAMALNILFLTENILESFILKKEIEVEKSRIDLYTQIKKQLAQYEQAANEN
jgi:hypothetical protein